jgi:hypothetical protein
MKTGPRVSTLLFKRDGGFGLVRHQRLSAPVPSLLRRVLVKSMQKLKGCYTHYSFRGWTSTRRDGLKQSFGYRLTNRILNTFWSTATGIYSYPMLSFLFAHSDTCRLRGGLIAAVGLFTWSQNYRVVWALVRIVSWFLLTFNFMIYFITRRFQIFIAGWKLVVFAHCHSLGTVPIHCWILYQNYIEGW